MTLSPKKGKRSRNYARGASTERFLRDDLYARGASIVMRGAGSKSVIPKEVAEKKWDQNPPKVDLIAVFPFWPTSVLFIQSKPRAGSIPKKQREALERFGNEVNACVAEGFRNKGAKYDIIHCSHSKEWANQCAFLA